MSACVNKICIRSPPFMNLEKSIILLKGMITMNKIRVLQRLHELQELKLQSFSADYECTAPRKGYEHEYFENKEMLDVIESLLTELSENV